MTDIRWPKPARSGRVAVRMAGLFVGIGLLCVGAGIGLTMRGAPAVILTILGFALGVIGGMVVTVVMALRYWPVLPVLTAMVLCVISGHQLGTGYLYDHGTRVDAIVTGSRGDCGKQGCIWTLTLRHQDGSAVDGTATADREPVKGSAVSIVEDPRGLYSPVLAGSAGEDRLTPAAWLLAGSLVLLAVVLAFAGATGERKRRAPAGNNIRTAAG